MRCQELWVRIKFYSRTGISFDEIFRGKEIVRIFWQKFLSKIFRSEIFGLKYKNPFSPKKQSKIHAKCVTIISAETLDGKFSRKFFVGNFGVIFSRNFKPFLENSPLFLISFSVFGSFLLFISDNIMNVYLLVIYFLFILWEYKKSFFLLLSMRFLKIVFLASETRARVKSSET